MTLTLPADSIPAGLTQFRTTPLFDAQTTPRALLGHHSTKSDVWGAIQVRSGRLNYIVTDARRVTTKVELTPEGSPGIIEPTILHRVEIVGDVEFEVEFWK